MRHGFVQRVAACLLLSAALIGCGGSSGSSSGTGYVQVLNAITDSPNLTLTLDEGQDTEATVNLSFQESTQLAQWARGSLTFEVTYEEPDTGATSTVLDTFTVDIVSDTIHTVYLHGSISNPTVLNLEREFETNPVVDSGEFSLQIVNLSSGDAVEAYFVAPDLDLQSEPATATLASLNATTATAVASGDKEFHVFYENEADPVYQSDPFEVFENARRTLVIHDEPGPDSRLIDVIVLADNGVIEEPNQVARTEIRVFNALAVETSVETALGTDGSPVTLEFGSASAFSVVDNASLIDLSITPASTGEDQLETISVNRDLFTTAVITKAANDSADITVASSSTSLRPIAGQANLHFINALSSTDVTDSTAIDLYLLPFGDGLDEVSPRSSGLNSLAGVTTTFVSGEVYTLAITNANSDAILAHLEISADSGSSVLAVATDAQPGSTARQIIVLQQ